MNAVQDHYACIEGLTMMHMDHAMPIRGGIMHLCHLQCTNLGDQNRCLGGVYALFFFFRSCIIYLSHIVQEFQVFERLNVDFRNEGV